MTTLDVRLGALAQAIDAARDRLPEDTLDDAAAVFTHADERRHLSSEHTVVVLGGSTGSGKSSLFNAIAGLDLASVGYLRPTTSEALSCAWGPAGANELLDWIGVHRRNQLSRRSRLDAPSHSTDLEGLVLLDLPDHDSVVRENKEVVDRSVAHADIFVWVLDPQKYADAALHDTYLGPRATHAGTTLVVLNHADRLSESDQELALADLRRILDAEGMDEVPVLATSALTGQGIGELREEISRRIQAKDAAATRLCGDVRAAALSLADAGGTVPAPGVKDGHRDKLIDVFEVCVGVEQMTDAVEDSLLRRAAVATDWPVIGWVGRLRRDPLKAVGLGRSVREALAPAMPMPPSVQRSRAELAMREVAESSIAGVARPWRSAILDQVTGRGARDVIDELDEAVSRVEPPLSRSPWWWSLFRFLQWAALISVLVGVAGLALGLVPGMSPTDWSFWPSPAGLRLDGWLLFAGLAAGLVLTILARLLSAMSSHRAAVRYERQLRDSIATTTDSVVLTRIQSELDRYERYRTGVLTASA